MTTFVDDCIEAYARGERLPFDEAYLTITLTSFGSLVPDVLRVFLHNGDTATEEVSDNAKVIRLLRLFVEQEQQIIDRQAAPRRLDSPW